MIETTYQIADRLISVACPDEIAGHSADSFLTELRASRVTRGSGSAAQLIMKRGRFQLPSNMRRCFTSVEAETEVVYYSGESSYVVTLGSSTVFAGDTTTVEITLAPDLDCSSLLFQRVLIHGLAAALRRAGAFELHCAALVDPRTSDATLLIGPSGSGKSTLAIQLAAKGWDFSTDDVALLTQTESGVEAHGLREHFAVTTETIANSSLRPFGADVLAGTANADGKYSVRPESWFAVRQIQKCSPRFLVFTERTGGRQSQVHRLNKAAVTQQLLRMCPWICMDIPTAPRYLRLLDCLARQCKSFALNAGTDLLGNEDYASHLLRSLDGMAA